MLTKPIWRLFDRLRAWREAKTLEPTQALGRRGEDVAHRYLEDQGYCVFMRNWRSRTQLNEIDLLAWMEGDPDRLIVVEVKSRRRSDVAAPDRNIDFRKQRSIRRAASEFCRRKNVNPLVVRFDTVSVTFEPKLTVEHTPDAFSWIHD